jgi:putative cardiolipin synthetase
MHLHKSLVAFRHIFAFVIVIFLTHFIYLPALAQKCRPAKHSDLDIVNFLQEDFGVKFTGNNRLVVFKTGKEKFDDLLPALRAAKQSIHLEYFNFRNDSISKELFAILVRKAAEGVKVRALFDGFGNSSNNRPLRARHLDSLRARGVEIYEFDPIRFPWINHVFHRDHRKIVVIDGVVAYTGGMNVADYYITGKPEFGEWRDIHTRVEGDAVGELQKVFLNFWNRVTHQNVHGAEYYPGERDARNDFGMLKQDTTPTAGSKIIGVVNRDPCETPRIIHDTFVHAIEHAEKQILIINPYFTLCRHIKRALKKAARRGVDVQIMVSQKSDIPVTPRVVEYNAHKLMKAGAKVYFFTGGFHHSKIMMVDSLYAFVGSANLNSRSLSFDYECNMLVADRYTTAQLQEIFYHDRDTRCFMLTPELWKNWGRWKKAKGWIFHFLSPFVKCDKKEGDNSGLGDFVMHEVDESQA